MGCTTPDSPIEFKMKKAFELHNQKRIYHGSPSLSLSENLNKLAQEYAEALAKKGKFFNNVYENIFLGENIYIYKGKDFDVENMCNSWYEENKNYNKNLSKYQKNTSHFTQMIWKETTEVGFGFKRKGKKNIGVALYYPPGNEFGKYEENVIFPSINKNI